MRHLDSGLWRLSSKAGDFCIKLQLENASHKNNHLLKIATSYALKTDKQHKRGLDKDGIDEPYGHTGPSHRADQWHARSHLSENGVRDVRAECAIEHLSRSRLRNRRYCRGVEPATWDFGGYAQLENGSQHCGWPGQYLCRPEPPRRPGLPCRRQPACAWHGGICDLVRPAVSPGNGPASAKRRTQTLGAPRTKSGTGLHSRHIGLRRNRANRRAQSLRAQLQCSRMGAHPRTKRASPPIAATGNCRIFCPAAMR